MRGPEPAPAAAILSAAELQNAKIDEAVARELKVDKSDMMGWWRRKFYIVGNAAFGSLTAMTATSFAGKALVGTAVAATLPSWAVSAAVGIPTVLAARYLLGLNKIDRMAKAGRVADKLKKQTRKLEKIAARTGHTVTMDEARLAERAKDLSRRVSWGAVAAGIGAGWLTGSIAYELHTGGPNPVTDTVRGGARGLWDRISSGSWWQARASGVWNALFGSVTPGDATPVASSVPPPAAAPVHVAACETAIREALVPFHNTLAAYATRLEGLESKIAELTTAVTDGNARLGVSAERITELQGQLTRLTDEWRLADSASAEEVRGLQGRIADLERTIEEQFRMLREAPAPSMLPGAGEAPRGGRAPEWPPSEPFPAYESQRLPYTTVPLDIEIQGPDDPIARYGLDGLLRETILASSDAPEIVNRQLIEAVRAVMVAHPEFAQMLQDTTRDVARNGDIVFQNSGVLNLRVFGNEDFLNLLRSEIERVNTESGSIVPKYSQLVPFLSKHGGIGYFLDTLRDVYQR